MKWGHSLPLLNEPTLMLPLQAFFLIMGISSIYATWRAVYGHGFVHPETVCVYILPYILCFNNPIGTVKFQNGRNDEIQIDKNGATYTVTGLWCHEVCCLDEVLSLPHSSFFMCNLCCLAWIVVTLQLFQMYCSVSFVSSISVSSLSKSVCLCTEWTQKMYGRLVSVSIQSDTQISEICCPLTPIRTNMNLFCTVSLKLYCGTGHH